MKLLFRYLQQHMLAIFAFVLFSGVFAIVLALYGVPLKAIVYPTLLCGVLGIVILAIGFVRMLERHSKLENNLNRMAGTMVDMPTANSVEQEDYARLIKQLQREVYDLELVSGNRYSETVEYYTVWVHQIKTPISAMRLKLQNEDNELSRSLLSDLLRIEQYVNMVLAFIRLDSVSTDYVIREYELDPIIKQSIKKLASEFITRRIRLDYGPVTVSAVTDEKWLGFVIEQVLSNALKYTRAGSISVYVRDNVLCISDTGIGIAAEDLPRIFDKGYTGLNGRADKKASGIGLYLCKRICDNLGHRISAKAEIGKGTTISIDLNSYKLKAE